METASSSETIQPFRVSEESPPHPLKDGASVQVLPPRPQSRNAEAVQIMRAHDGEDPLQSVKMSPA